ncbi:hypothetical protein SAMN05660464_1182 [Geodermatophilus dictyosporus]|uniref:DUF1326 domain-containing protein n=1 Tax=Geodermatophilus dictyosporus TaxID=1523247 RepID=A0A1I5K1J7_9ACTN|nr:DUF1326 domain-containing protein [Geodermatophilus dictyosporus]SFO78603.1 hypothetical protein SAMN05660464_1182 [Geodermatophilus dictyosporus]
MSTTGSGTRLPAHALAGWFVETCDCETLCPCWVDEDPDDDHCTGLFAWVVEDGRLPGDGGPVDVAGARVVSISTHDGRRRGPDGGRYSVLFVDVDDVPAHGAEAYDALARAFGAPEGPLADLAEVMGAVLSVSPAAIRVESGEGRDEAGGWRIRVHEKQQVDGARHPTEATTSDIPAFEADGADLAFDRPDGAGDGVAAAAGGEPLTLNRTALHRELAAVGSVTAMTATRFRLNLPVLPGGYADATRRSAMRGRFAYPTASVPSDG